MTRRGNRGFAKNSRIAKRYTMLAIAKEAFAPWDAKCFEKGLARSEQIYLDELMRTEDAKEGIKAYVEKRRPVWKAK